MKKICYVFPGQGGQFVGMGKDLYERDADARRVFDEVDDFLGEKLSSLIFEGPMEELNKPENLQPAIFAASMATFLSWKNPSATPDIPGGPIGPVVADFVAGHSLGEYAALVAAGCAGIGSVAKLLRKRGELMQAAAAEAGEGAMAAIVGTGWTAVEVEKFCEEAIAEVGGICEVANDNGVGNQVISGTTATVLRAMEIAKAKGAKLVKQLAVSVPAHSSLMVPAVDGFRAALNEIEWKTPTVPFISNRTAEVMTDIGEIKESLAYQLTHGVRWRESVLKLAELGVEEIVEIGPGNVLTGMCKRIVPDVKCEKLEI